MFEEPYRWVEAVGNRRHYLDEQFQQGSPVVGLSYQDGLYCYRQPRHPEALRDL